MKNLFYKDTEKNGVNVLTASTCKNSTMWYNNLSIDTAARMFVPYQTNDQDDTRRHEDFAMLDDDYLNEVATTGELSELVNSAMKYHTSEAIENIMISINQDRIPEVINNMDLDISSIANLEGLVEFLEEVEAKTLFTRQDKDDNYNIAHNAALWPAENYADLLELIVEKTDLDTVSEMMLQESITGNIPAALSDGAAIATIDFYNKHDRLDVLSQIFTNQDLEGDAILHGIEDLRENLVMLNLFDALKDEPQLLADILMVKNNDGDTAYKKLDKLDENVELVYIKDKIIELATDSDLSVEKSIALLEANKLEPQIVEYLKLQG